MITSDTESPGTGTGEGGATDEVSGGAQAASTAVAPTHRVKIPALAVYVLFFAGGLLLDRTWPLPFRHGALGEIVGWLVLGLGVALIVWTLLTFLVRRVSPASFVPTSQLITGGPFAMSRHPLYLGGLVAYLGGALLGDLTWAMVAAIPLAIVIQRFFVAREEAYLEEQFGDEFRAYAARVRRWI